MTDPSMKWAYWAGLFITAGDVLIALALTNASDPKKTPADFRVASAVAKRLQLKAAARRDCPGSCRAAVDNPPIATVCRLR
jgi:hypothetical protein